jgi:4-amino-4-deoxy-L-arabinose transferase-like glycosyltransferase
MLRNQIAWLILIPTIFVPRLLNLDVFLTIDEPLFLDHARQFAAGLSSGDFIQTLGIGYPGVTVAWWSAPVVGLASTELGAYAAGRFVTAMITGILLLIMYGLSRSLVGRWSAFIGVILLALDPFMLSYSRLLHIEAILALLMTLAGLSCLLWLRNGRWGWVLLAGLFAGLALLTKSTALLLGPMLGIVMISWAMATAQWRNPTWWAAKLLGLAVVVFVALITFFILWPAMWVAPTQALNLTFNKLFTDQAAGTGNLGLFWMGRFVEDPGTAFYPVAFLLKATPWLFIGLILNLWFIIRPSSFNFRPTLIALWLFALTYLVLMTIASKKSIRYMLPAFPTFYLLTGWAFYQLGESVRQRIGKRRPKLLPASYFLLLILLTLFTFIYHPYYFTYANPLVLGWRWAPQAVLIGWGEGLDEAARYLNAQPLRRVAAWYESIFPILYHGEVEPVVPQENLLTADRAVLYINQVQRDIPGPNIIHYFRTRRQPEYTVRLNGIEYAWVYPGPVVGLNQPAAAPAFPFAGQFGDEAQLLGYNLHPQPRSGDPLIITLYWRVLVPPSAERFVTLRLIDDQGRIWAQADSPPVMGLWPVARWKTGMFIEDAHQLDIPPGTPPGVYRLEVGLYDPASGQVLPATGQPVSQGGGLLLGQVPVAWQVTSAAPVLARQTDARLAPNARLVGYNAVPAAATSGDVLSLRLAWKESPNLAALWAVPNDFAGFIWRSANGQATPPQLDELPLPIAEWGRGATLLSQHQIIVPPALESGTYELAVLLHTGSNPAGEAFTLGQVNVTVPLRQFDIPAAALLPDGPAQLAQGVSLAGYQLERAGENLALALYWQTDASVTTRYKIFVQLLAPDNTVVAQSDAFPAAGQRSTTGWLPGEIISDIHPLTLPADVLPGNYRLIAGLYNPTTGERLPVVDKSDESGGDAIFVTEVVLP